MSLGETQLRPTAMLFRNLVSMGNLIDGVVLLMVCDKTTPALLMGAASCDLPSIGLSGVLDVAARRLHLEVSDAELTKRRASWTGVPAPSRGWYELYADHVQQAHLGADLDILNGGSGTEVPRDSH